jgi:hypothetical protein
VAESLEAQQQVPELENHLAGLRRRASGPVLMIEVFFDFICP